MPTNIPPKVERLAYLSFTVPVKKFKLASVTTGREFLKKNESIFLKDISDCKEMKLKKGTVWVYPCVAK
jgi:hypothetical protein